jgi:hypothetical protein
MTTARWRLADAEMQLHVLSLAGADPYAQAGGIASRLPALTEAPAEAGFDTHLWCIGVLDGACLSG